VPVEKSASKTRSPFMANFRFANDPGLARACRLRFVNEEILIETRLRIYAVVNLKP